MFQFIFAALLFHELLPTLSSFDDLHRSSSVQLNQLSIRHTKSDFEVGGRSDRAGDDTDDDAEENIPWNSQYNSRYGRNAGPAGDPDSPAPPPLVCPRPCKCPDQENTLKCEGGVNIIKDGCGCCFICSRPQGDQCDRLNLCDKDKSLYCDFSVDGGMRGICRAQPAQSCEVDGKIYSDGEQFKPNCSLLCTCQNGLYACASVCPQEERAPSREHCSHAQLLSIAGRCCREWVCPYASQNFLHQRPDNGDGPGNFEISPGFNGGNSKRERCTKENSSWSPCSVTCGFGRQFRLMTNTTTCLTYQDRRLCLLRPCQLNNTATEDLATFQSRVECKKATWQQETPIHLVHEGCTSIKEFRPKYCSMCKRCCRPDYTKKMLVEMHCSPSTGERNNTTVEKFMWIKSCKCKESYCKK